MTDVVERIEELHESGLFRRLRLVSGPQGPRVILDGKPVLLLCSNNYLGFADHPRVREAYQIVGDACRASGKALGMGGVYELDAMKRYADLGAHFILTGSDHAYILAGASLRSAFFRKLEADRKAS